MATTTTTEPAAEDLAKDARVLAVHASSVGIDIEVGEVRVYASNRVADVIAHLLASMSDQDSLVEVKVSWAHATKSGNTYTPSVSVIGV
jgi:hypothetical protein